MICHTIESHNNNYSQSPNPTLAVITFPNIMRHHLHDHWNCSYTHVWPRRPGFWWWFLIWTWISLPISLMIWFAWMHYWAILGVDLPRNERPGFVHLQSKLKCPCFGEIKLKCPCSGENIPSHDAIDFCWTLFSFEGLMSQIQYFYLLFSRQLWCGFVCRLLINVLRPRVYELKLDVSNRDDYPWAPGH
jgi:hypothetical protein